MLELHENLKKILQAKNLETFYSEIYGQKIFVYVGLNLETWLFNDEKIYKLQDGEFKLSSIEEFSNFIKSILEDFKVQNTHFQNLLEHKEGIILKGGFVKNFYKKSFVLRQKINKNLKQINLLSEAFNLLLSEQAQYKKHLKILNLSISILSKNTKEHLARVDILYTLTNAIKNEKMNKSIYLLSILSSIFLPLNLIVGFFGMNTNNLFFKDSPYGTLYIFSLICCILIVGFIFYYSKKTKEFDLDEGKKAKKQTK